MAPRPAGDRAVRLLVTGVPGWLGNAFLESVAATPIDGVDSVRCLVESEWAPQPDLAGLQLERTVGDLRDADRVADAVRDVDLVLHAAGVLHVRRTQDWYDVNAGGTRSLVGASVHAGVRRFVLISTNAAAGKGSGPHDVLTEDRPAIPRSHYGRSKLLAEQALLAERDRIETVVLRPSMFYGPPVPPRHVAVYRRVRDGRMPLVGDGRHTRSVTYIENLVQACRLALAHPAAAGQTYFIADERPATTREIVEAMAEALDVRPRYLRLPDVAARIAYGADQGLAALGVYWRDLHLLGEADWHVGVSSDKAWRQLGYRPTVALRDGMRRAMDWCRQQGLL